MADRLMNSQRRILVGRIGPAVVLICLLLDFSLRFLPPRLITFREWEAQTLFAADRGPFVANGLYRNARSYGDLANLANLPRLRQYREEVFSTDAAGYRNRGGVAKPFTGILLIGDSYVAGSGVSDTQILSEQLKSMSGRRVYNGALTPNFEDLLHDLQMTHGLVVWEQLERLPLPVAKVPEHSWKRKLLLKSFGSDRSESLLRIYKSAYSYWSYSPLKTMFGRTVRLLQNDKMFPNPYQSQTVDAKLINGQEILFVPLEVSNYELNRPTNTEFFVGLKTQLQKKGIDLLVLLVPDKYDAYHDLLLSASPRAKQAPFLDAFEQRLDASDVPVLNLRPRFRKQAETLLARGEYLYWLDDSHWNATGIHEAAQAILDSKAVSQCSCR